MGHALLPPDVRRLQRVEEGELLSDNGTPFLREGWLGPFNGGAWKVPFFPWGMEVTSYSLGLGHQWPLVS